MELYGIVASPPCRIAMMALECTNTPYKMVDVDPRKGDTKTAEFKKINPLGKIPTLKKDKFVVSESVAIATYVANAYDKKGELYPKDPKVRGRVEQVIYFNEGVFFAAFGNTVFPKLMGKEIAEGAREKLAEALRWASDMVGKTGYAAGTDHITLADLCFIATYSTVRATGHIDLGEYHALEQWFQRVRGEVPKYDELFDNGAEEIGLFFRHALGLEGYSNFGGSVSQLLNGTSTESEDVGEMGIKVFGMDESPPCRVVYMTCEAAGVPYATDKIDVMAEDNMKPEYLKMNPQHAIPTMKEGDFVMSESKAIAAYVASKYDKSGRLYPKDPVVRGRVDQRVYFHEGTFYPKAGEVMFAAFSGKVRADPEAYSRLAEALDWFSDSVDPTGYVAGTNHITLADISFLATFATLDAHKSCRKELLEGRTALYEWFERCKRDVGRNYERACGKGAAACARFLEELAGKLHEKTDPRTSRGTRKTLGAVDLKIYGLNVSPPCRYVYMTCEVSGAHYEEILTDVNEGGTRTPDFLKMNPQHTVPTLKEGNFVISESKAIAAYIAAKYDKSGRLYPKDPEIRGAVDHRIHFHDSAFNDRLRAVLYYYYYEAGSPPAEDVTKMKEALRWLEDMVRPTGYAAGTEYVTLADLAFLATYSTIRRTTLPTSEASPAFETSPAFQTSPVSKASPIHAEYPLLEEWLERVKTAVPNYEKANEEGADAMANRLSASPGLPVPV